MNAVKSLIGIALIVSGMVYLIFDRFNRKRLIEYFYRFKGSLLSDEQSKKLIGQHTDFIFGKIEPYPSNSLYPSLYSNEEFKDFILKSKRKKKWMLYTIALFFTINLVFSLLDPS